HDYGGPLSGHDPPALRLTSGLMTTRARSPGAHETESRRRWTHRQSRVSVNQQVVGSNSVCWWRNFHAAMASNTALPSLMLTAGSDTGYQATYPNPRIAVKGSLIWSQSFRRAISAGTPMRVSREASCVTVPPYCTSNVTTAPGGTSFAIVTTTSNNPPV